VIRVIVVGALVAAGLAAQSPMMSPWWEGPTVRDLNLTEDQQKKIRSTVAGSRSKIILLRATLEAAEADLADLMSDDPVDLLKGKAAIEKVLAARTDLGRQVAGMSLALRQILTAQQWRELERRQQQPRRPELAPNHPENLRNQPRPAGPPPPDGQFWQLMVVARTDAETMANNLRQKGFPVQLRPVPNNNSVRVLVGPFPDPSAMEKAKGDLERAGFPNAVRPPNSAPRQDPL
jgi:Spy/CpxP family protein refolding chaperone